MPDGSRNDRAEIAIARVTGQWAAASPSAGGTRQARPHGVGPPGLARRCWRSVVLAPDHQLAPVRPGFRRNSAARWTRRQRPEPRRLARPGPGQVHRSWPGGAGGQVAGRGERIDRGPRQPAPAGDFAVGPVTLSQPIPNQALQGIDGGQRSRGLLRRISGDVSLVSPSTRRHAHQPNRPRSQAVRQID